MEPYLFAVLVAAGFFVVSGYRWLSEPRRRARRVLGQTRNVPIAEIKDGQVVKVTGVVEAIDPPITAAVSQRAWVGSGLVVPRIARGPPIVLRRGAWGPFWFRDDTGTAVVDGPFVFGLDWEDDWSIVSQGGRGSLRA